MAPPTPTPGASCSLAALTMASTASVVMSTIRAETGTGGSDGRKRETGALDLDRDLGPDGAPFYDAGKPPAPSMERPEKAGTPVQADVGERVEHSARVARLAHLEHDLSKVD